MAAYHPATIDMVAAALTHVLLTPREIEPLLPIDLHRTTIRSVLHLLVRDGRALAEGDIYQRRYRMAGAAI
jgi:hypothetical protein